MPRGIFIARRGQLPKEYPPIPCKACGTPIHRKRMPCGELESGTGFLKRRFCCKKCAGTVFSKSYRKEEALYSASHRKARMVKPPGPCERCGTPDAKDVHHIDENWRNNSPENLERVCRKCHTKHHKSKIKI